MISKKKTLINICIVSIFISFTSISYGSKSSKISIDLSQELKGWKEKKFKGSTHYTVKLKQGDKILKAKSKNSASGIFKTQRINIKKYPFINWKWKIKNKLINDREKSKSGDDYSARVFVLANKDFSFWNTKGICYVWSSSSKGISYYPSPYTPNNIKIITLCGPSDETSQWYKISRNVYKDFSSLYDTEFKFINKIAIMTDTDNIGQEATAFYKNIYFSKKPPSSAR